MAVKTFGRDLWCRTSLVTTRYATGVDLIVNALARRITTKKGTLYFHRDYGVNPPSIGDTLDAGTLQRLEFCYKNACESDRRVRDGSVRVTITEVQDRASLRTDLQIAISGDSSLGPFDFVATVDRVTLALIGVQEAA